jgi:hypothetical protein
MFQAVRLQNFKAFESITVRLGAANVLVGVNNAGKSTILDAFRALSGGLRVAHQRKASVVEPDRQGFHVGNNIPSSLLPITTKNVHTDYRDENAILTFTLQSRRVMRMVFPADGGCRLPLDAGLHEVSTLRKFSTLYPVSVNVIPTPGPFEEEEDCLSDEYFS